MSPGLATPAAKLRLAAYVILSLAVAVAFFLVVQNIDSLKKERAARIRQGDQTYLILCSQVNSLKSHLRKRIDESQKEGKTFETKLNKKLHFISPEALAQLLAEGEKQIKKFDAALSLYNCNNLPVFNVNGSGSGNGSNRNS